ncbi:MAG TPA: hypothetical protein DCL08_01920 [Anaerolineaceae bacterium]|nr:hypothetical protein [Anaerolineaceae bacterium]
MFCKERTNETDALGVGFPTGEDTCGIKVELSRTIADLAGSVPITQVHLAEVLQYQPKLDLM